VRQRKPREAGGLHVIRKPKAGHAGAHGGEGWAVSYADLLMVLLSFFVMFFTFKEENPDTVEAQVIKVARAMQGEIKEKPTPQPDIKDDETYEAVSEDQAGVPIPSGQAKEIPKGQSDPTKTEVGVTNSTAPKIEDDPRLLEISKALQIDGVRVTNDKSQLVVTMNNSAFEPASYLLSISLQARINDVLRQLKPYYGTIQLTVVGHADRSNLRSRSDLLQDNFDLSSIRALRVLKYVVNRGFPENRASARASSFFDRDARSVTFVIQSAPKAPNREGV
jgi:flagellar motor protein MotB